MVSYDRISIFKLISKIKPYNNHTIDRFKIVTDKDIRKMTYIVKNLIR
jgi:hypothetical protein